MPPNDSEQTRWFAAEVQPHGSSLRAFLLARYPSLPDVENLVQECLVRVLRAHERGRVDSPRALLFATARNLALDAVRRQQVISFEPIAENPDSFVFMDNTDVPEAVSQQQEFELLTEAIQLLPGRCRQVFTLRMAFGMSQREIAEELVISESAVEKHMTKGIRRCAEFFARLGMG